MESLIAQLTGFITALIESLGYVGIALLLLIENIFPPIPSEAILPLAGFLVSQQEFWFPWVLLASTIGSVAGAFILYYIGNIFGEERIFQLTEKYGKFLGIKKKEIKTAMHWFETHGGKVVFYGRLVPGIRSLVSIPAGLAHMPLKKFFLYTTLGSGLWNTFLISLGWILGDQWQQVEQYMGYVEYLVLLLFIGLIGWIFWKRQQKRRE